MSDTYTPFQTLQYNQQEVSQRGWGIATAGPRDDQMNVGFYPKPIPIGKNDAGGKPIHKTVDYVKISHPGEANLMQRDVEVTEEHRMRWPRQWAQYRAGREQIPDGIPLDLLFPQYPHIAKNLRGHGIHTVEQLAKLSGQGLDSVGMGAQEWVNAANRYLSQAEKGVNYHKFNEEMKAKDQQIATLQRQIAELSQLVKQRLQTTAPAENFDYQTAQINQTHPSTDHSQAYLQQPAQFVQDLSGSMQPPKRRGRIPGSKNKPKEQNNG